MKQTFYPSLKDEETDTQREKIISLVSKPITVEPVCGPKIPLVLVHLIFLVCVATYESLRKNVFVAGSGGWDGGGRC